MQNQVEKDKDAFQVELGVLRNQKERSNLEVISLREELGLKNSKITEMERVIRDLKDRQTPQETTENEVCLLFLDPMLFKLG